MGFVMFNDERGLAMVVPTEDGGTKCLYLTGDLLDDPGLRLDDVSDGLDVGVQGSDRIAQASSSRLGKRSVGLLACMVERAVHFVLKAHGERA
jgi:hypothetical protein